MAFPSVTYTFSNGTTADATQVNQNFTDLINGFSDGTKNLNMSAITAGGATTLNGAVTLGSGTGNDITINGSIAANIPVKTNTSFDFGTATLGLKSIYIGGSSTFTVRIQGPTLGSSYTLTLPTVPASTAPMYISSAGTVTARLPTVQTFTSGSGTYNTPAGVSYIRVVMVGGGGGGAGSGTATGTAAGDGGNTTFGTTLLVANGGAHGVYDGAGGVGGTASLGSGPIGIAVSGGNGQGAQAANGTTTRLNGGQGGASFLGGNGGGGPYNSASATGGSTNSGGGGGGAGDNVAGASTGGGGGAGGYVDAIITNPSASYSYAVGGAGSAGGAGTSGNAGSAGAAGQIIVFEF